VVAHSFFLILRTVLSIGVARLDGMIVRDLVRADGKGFLRGLGLWFLLAIPSTYTNSMVSVSIFFFSVNLTEEILWE
jgi:ATP-binding cassette subfamily D (ALD) long-chain fatty acid import protein